MAIDTARRTLLSPTAIAGVATFVRLLLGRIYFGFHKGDDVEVLAAGFMRALELPYRPWEIRNLLVSDLLVAPALALAAAAGVRSTETLVWLSSIPLVLLASLNVCIVFQLTRQWLESDRPALLAASLYAFHWLPLGYGSTVYPRTAAVTCVLLAAWCSSRRERAAWNALLAGGLLGIAWAIRYSEVVFLAPLLAALWLRRDGPSARLAGGLMLLGGFVGVSLLTVGLEDALTWGRPFASLIAFARYTLVEHQSSSLEPMQPWYWYLWRLPKWLPLTLLPFLWRSRRVSGAASRTLFLILPLLVLSAIHHKQLRYLQGLIPFLMILAAAGAWSYWQVGRRRLVMALAALSFLWGLSGVTFLQKKSMAAVRAAQAIAALPDRPAPVCLSQSWAYGGGLYLGSEAAVRDLPYPLSADVLAAALPKCSVVALYEEDYRKESRMPAVLAEHGFERSGDFRYGRSKPVLVFDQRGRGAAADGRPRLIRRRLAGLSPNFLLTPGDSSALRTPGAGPVRRDRRFPRQSA
jgi:hypothetical protein